MPDDSDRIDSIKRDLDYYRAAHQSMGVGGQPPTVHAAKYADDVGYLLGLISEKDNPAQPLEKSQLEIALDHDVAGRVERVPGRRQTR
jgi:hypothetical protein